MTKASNHLLSNATFADSIDKVLKSSAAAPLPDSPRARRGKVFDRDSLRWVPLGEPFRRLGFDGSFSGALSSPRKMDIIDVRRVPFLPGVLRSESDRLERSYKPMSPSSDIVARDNKRSQKSAAGSQYQQLEGMVVVGLSFQAKKGHHICIREFWHARVSNPEPHGSARGNDTEFEIIDVASRRSGPVFHQLESDSHLNLTYFHGLVQNVHHIEADMLHYERNSTGIITCVSLLSIWLVTCRIDGEWIVE